jgi:hypothetical protein
MGWQAAHGKSPCQSTEDAKPMAIPETCPSGEEPPEAKPVRRQSPSGGKARPEAKPVRRQKPGEDIPKNHGMTQSVNVTSVSFSDSAHRPAAVSLS